MKLYQVEVLEKSGKWAPAACYDDMALADSRAQLLIFRGVQPENVRVSVYER